jgi:hypothetical protein
MIFTPVFISVHGTLNCAYPGAEAPNLVIYDAETKVIQDGRNHRWENGLPGRLYASATNTLSGEEDWLHFCWTPVLVIPHTCNKAREWKFSVTALDETCYRGPFGKSASLNIDIDLTDVDNPMSFRYPVNWEGGEEWVREHKD